MNDNEINDADTATSTPKSGGKALLVFGAFCLALVVLVALNMK